MVFSDYEEKYHGEMVVDALSSATKQILDEYFSGRENYRPQDLIVHKGDYATKAYGQRK